MKIFLMFLILGLSKLGYADEQKLYYDSATNQTVLDISGKKDYEKIKQEFRLSEQTQVIIVDPDKNIAGRVKNGVLETYNPKKENQDKAEQEATVKLQKEAALKTKFGWTDEDLAALKAIFK